MTALTMRPTGLGHGVYKDDIDYSVFSGVWLIGRIYERKGFPDAVRFFWSLHGVALTRAPDIHTDGHTPSLATLLLLQRPDAARSICLRTAFRPRPLRRRPSKPALHRGVEVAADWRPLPGWRLIAAYTYLDQFYVDYTEQLSTAPLTARFDRGGNKIPGISPNELFTRLGYDQPIGPWRGVGGFVEYVWKDGFYMENANLLRAPGYSLVNVNVHYDTEIDHPYLKGAIYFFEVKNLLDTTYIASANNITDSLNTATGLQNPGSVLANTGTGSIYAGAPRTFVAGMRLAFR